MRLSRLFVPLTLFLAAANVFASNDAAGTLKAVFLASPDEIDRYFMEHYAQP
jgi:hypothetical protein